MDRLQILDLHTINPLVSYRGQLYSCRWASPLGTDLLFVDKRLAANKDADALRSFQSYNLLGASVAKLLASDANLRPRTGPPFKVGRPPVYSDGKIKLPLGATPTQKNQKDFIEKLNAVKRRKGEGDKVHLAMVRQSGEISEDDEEDEGSFSHNVHQRLYDSDDDYVQPVQPVQRGMLRNRGDNPAKRGRPRGRPPRGKPSTMVRLSGSYNTYGTTPPSWDMLNTGYANAYPVSIATASTSASTAVENTIRNDGQREQSITRTSHDDTGG